METPDLTNSGRIPDPIPEHTPLFRWLAKILTNTEARLRALGGAGVRWGIRLFFGFVAAVGIFLLVGPVINAPMSFDDVIDSAEIDEVDWIARDVQADYAIDRDAQGGFVAQIEERFTADFRNGPESSVERVIITEYGGRDVGFELHSATIDGEAVEATVTQRPTTTAIRLTQHENQPFEGQQEISLSHELHHLVGLETDEATGATVDRLFWPLFAPTWPQATKGIDVSLTLAPELDEALVRAPQAYVGWLLVSGVSWLEPEDAYAGEGVRYTFSNDDTLPPNADVSFNASFREGTFTLPPTTNLFWLQTYGPLLPLAILAVLLLFSLAARRIVWADSAGDPWYVPRSDPPDGISPRFAAELLRKPRHAELMDAFAEGPDPAASGMRTKRRPSGKRKRDSGGGLGRASRLRSIAQAGRRAGRWGNLPSTLRWMMRWRIAGAVEARGLRWVPDNYVRDVFLLAPAAIALLQWGLLRQLSHQVILAIVWWPFVCVVVSTLLAALTVAAVWRPRPLTPEGARAVQQLKGIQVHAEVTRLADRGPVDDAILPYALLFDGPRRAGRVAADLAAQDAGEADLSAGWRTRHFVSGGAFVALAAAVAVLAGAIVAVSVFPTPYDGSIERVTRHDDLPGTFFTEVTGFEISAELARGDEGTAEIRVTERHDVRFEGTASRVPQFAREWPTDRLGQDLGLEIESFRVDGDAVPYREVPGRGSRAAVTQLEEVLDGVYEVEIEYVLASAAVSARVDGAAVEQVRWTALYHFWEDFYYTDPGAYFDGRSLVRPIRFEFTVAPELVDEVIAGGWIANDYDRDREDVPGEHGDWFSPWVSEERVYEDSEHEEVRPEAYDIRVGSETRRDDGAFVAVIDVDEAESRKAARYEEDLPEQPFAVNAEVNAWLGQHELNMGTDAGVRLDFAPGTFTGVSERAYDRHRVLYALPFNALIGLAGAVVVASAGVIVFCRRSKRPRSLSLATVSYLAIPLATAAQCVLFFWCVSTMSGSDARGGAAMAAGTVMLAAVVTQVVFVARRGAKDSRDSG